MCDYPLAGNLVLLSVAVASKAVMRFAISGAKDGWTATLGDFAVMRWQG